MNLSTQNQGRTLPQRKRLGRGTKTSSFGVSKREGHDSSEFYGRKIYEKQSQRLLSQQQENILPHETLDQIFCKSSETMTELPDRSIHLAITSPPYNVGKTYDLDLTMQEYRRLLTAVFRELYRVLVDGGRLCVNIANIGRKPYIPIHSLLIADLLDLGYLMRGEIIWNKGSSAGSSTAWGSWQSASNPALRDVHEYILVFSKSNFSRGKTGKDSSIGRDEFLEFTKSIWDFPAESASRIGHPAPFPVELARRCIQLYSFKDDVILDPFCGSGTTCIASIETQRHFVGYETNENYVHLALERIRKYKRKS